MPRSPFRKFAPKSNRPRLPAAARTSWEPVAEWYGDYTAEKGTLIADVVHPGTVRLLNAPAGATHLDIACGEGALSRLLAQNSVAVTGFDASPTLVAQAESRAPKNARYFTGDARYFDKAFDPGSFDSATCTLALQNIERFADVFSAASKVLKPGAPLVFVINHPAFRIPRATSWGWDEEKKLMYRRVDKYLSPFRIEIQAHPGSAPSIVTDSFHRPLSAYVEALTKHGFLIEKLEEWISNRQSKPGGRAAAENSSRIEFPMFLAIRAVKK